MVLGFCRARALLPGALASLSISAPGKGLVKKAVPLAWDSHVCEVAEQILPLSPQTQEMLPSTSWATHQLPYRVPTRR